MISAPTSTPTPTKSPTFWTPTRCGTFDSVPGVGVALEARGSVHRLLPPQVTAPVLEAQGTRPAVRRGYEVERLHNPLLRADRLLGGSQDSGRHFRCYGWLVKSALKDRNEQADEEVHLRGLAGPGGQHLLSLGVGVPPSDVWMCLPTWKPCHWGVFFRRLCHVGMTGTQLSPFSLPPEAGWGESS